jgi:serine/threonine protein phosphatase PrpC
MNCELCTEPVAGTDRFCESCGSPLWPGSESLDHRETDLGPVAAVSDRGLKRSRNEDYYAIEALDGVLLAAVCDGVATTEDAGVASAAAARAALDRVLTRAAGTTDWCELAHEAIVAAQQAVAPETRLNIPYGSTTIALALVQPGEIVVANVGDSRAYWLDDDGSNLLLSVDDSFHTHELTAWLGPDADPVAPHVVCHRPAGGGLVVLCSDGLWNYAEPADSVGELTARSLDRRPVGVARYLVQAAIDAGGADNVTVAVLAHPIEQSLNLEKGRTSR